VGTEVTLAMPMALGVASALIVEAGGKLYALPLESVQETFKTTDGRITRMMAGWGTDYRGSVLPLNGLGELLGDRNDTGLMNRWSDAGDGSELPVVVLKKARGRLGVVVDRLHRKMEITIKPLPVQFATYPHLSGVSIMGDGRVVFVLNPEGIGEAQRTPEESMAA